MYTHQYVLDPERAVGWNVAASHRQFVLALVPPHRFRRVLQPQRASHFYHQYGAQDLDRGRVLAGCAGIGWTHEPSDHAEVHRSERRGASPGRGPFITG